MISLHKALVTVNVMEYWHDNLPIVKRGKKEMGNV